VSVLISDPVAWAERRFEIIMVAVTPKDKPCPGWTLSFDGFGGGFMAAGM
jgi:hypothetical protein